MTPVVTLQGRSIFPGQVSGEVLVSRMGISFYGGVDPETGIVTEAGHDLAGQSVAGKVLIFPTGKGSTVGSYVLYRLKKNGHAPSGDHQRRMRDHHRGGLHHRRDPLSRPGGPQPLHHGPTG